MKWRLFAFVGDLPAEASPPVVGIQGESFAVRHVFCSLPRADNLVHVEVVSPPHWQSILCKRARKLQEDGCDMDCWGMTFVPPDGSYRLLG